MRNHQAFGRRSVLELFESGLAATEIFINPGASGQSFKEIVDVAEAREIRIVHLSRTELDRMSGGKNHQGVIVLYKPVRLIDVSELLDMQDRGSNPPILILDGIEDPRNFGAIIRSGEVLGAGGVVFRKRRAVGVTPLAVKASAGAALRLPLAVCSNLVSAMKLIKDKGYWIYGLDPAGEKSLWDLEMDVPIGFVLGSEGDGLGRLVRDHCDCLVRIPQLGHVASLNVSVSAALAVSEWLRHFFTKSGKRDDL